MITKHSTILHGLKIAGLFLIITFVAACNKHYMSLAMLQEQLNVDKLDEISRKKIISYGAYEFFKTSYKPNGLWEVICIEKKTGKRVALSINKDTTLVITDKKGKKHKLYFDTVHIYDNSVYGLHSRFINNPKTINFEEIDKIEIHAELSKSRAL